MESVLPNLRCHGQFFLKLTPMERFSTAPDSAYPPSLARFPNLAFFLLSLAKTVPVRITHYDATITSLTIFPDGCRLIARCLQMLWTSKMVSAVSLGRHPSKNTALGNVQKIN